METCIAVLGIIVENPDATDQLNRILHDYSGYIVGRLGIPYRKRGLSVISIIIDAPADAISALTGKLGMLEGVSAKALYAKVEGGHDS